MRESRRPPTAMVGRARELAILVAALDDTDAGSARFVAVGGEGGVGKTRLLSEFAALARSRGFGVHRGTCPPATAGMSVPFAPITSALRSVVRSIDARLVEVLLGAGRRDLAALLPELGEPDAESPSATGVSQARLFEAVLSLLERASRRSKGLVVVLEDLHWSDPTARLLLAWLVEELRSAPVMIVASYRSGPEVDDGLGTLLVELDRLETTTRFELQPLEEPDAERLVDAITGGSLGSEARRDLARRAGCLPLFIEELAAGAHGQGPPASLRMSVARRLGQLDADARRVAELLGAADGAVTVGLLGVAAAQPHDRLRASLVALDGLGMLAPLAPSPDAVDEVALRHGLLGEAILVDLPRARVEARHAAWADAIESSPGSGPRSPLERTAALARHRVASGDTARSSVALVQAAEAAVGARAFGAAHTAYERALRDADAGTGPVPGDALQVLDGAAAAAWLAGRSGTAVRRATQASAVMDERDPEHQDGPARARRGVRLATYLAADGQVERARTVLEQALEQLPPGEVRWLALLDLGRVQTLLGRPDAAAACFEAALDGAQAGHLPRVASRAAAALAVAWSTAGRHADALLLLDGPHRGRDALPTDASSARRHLSRLPDAVAQELDEAVVRLRSHDPAGSLDATIRASEAAAQRGLTPMAGGTLAATAAWCLIRLGRWQDASARLESAAPRDAMAPGAWPWRAVRAWLASARGHWDEAAGLENPLPRSTATLPGPDWHAIHLAAAAWGALGRGAPLDARRRLAVGLRDLRDGDPASTLELLVLGMRVESEVVATALRRGDGRALLEARQAAAELDVRARVVLDRLAGESAPAARRHWISGLASALDGERSLVADVPDVDAWDGALAAADALGEPFARAVMRLRSAGILVRRDATRARAAQLLREALALADQLGAAPLADEVERVARRARIATRPGAASVGPRAAALSLGLSDREVDVLALLALGQTDRELSRTLFISQKTAGHHVSHILTKLGVTRRGEAAVVAHRLGLVGLAEGRG